MQRWHYSPGMNRFPSEQRFRLFGLWGKQIRVTRSGKWISAMRECGQKSRNEDSVKAKMLDISTSKWPIGVKNVLGNRIRKHREQTCTKDKENKVCIKQNEIVKINKFANITLSKSYEKAKIANNRLKGRTSWPSEVDWWSHDAIVWKSGKIWWFLCTRFCKLDK